MNYRGLNIPFTSFGAVTSDDLFGVNDQGVFDFYESNKSRYSKVLDIGANIGIHSILMARQGWEVFAFEPDPVHYGRLVDNVKSHGVTVNAVCAAVSDHAGEAQFTRVLGNTTGSHLTGLKQPYGDLETFTVDIVDARTLFAWADFAKVDAEGAEADIVSCFVGRCDLMVEIGDKVNAGMIWRHMQNRGLRCWSQCRDWKEARAISHIPKHHSEGALFIGREPPFA